MATEALPAAPVQLPALRPALPESWDVGADVDCRIYTLVVIGRILQGLAVASVLAIGAVTVLCSPLALIGLIVPILLGGGGNSLVNARLLPDGSIHIPFFTRIAFVPGQPVGLVRQGYNCCINSALQIAFTSAGVQQGLDAAPAEHVIKGLQNNCLTAQAQRQFVANADTQLARLFISSPKQLISPSSSIQEDAGEVLNLLLDALETEAVARSVPALGLERREAAKLPVLPFAFQIAEKLTRISNPADIKNLDSKKEHQLLLSLQTYVELERAGQLPAGLSDEQAFMQYIFEPFFNDQNEVFQVEKQFVQPPTELFVQANRTVFVRDAQPPADKQIHLKLKVNEEPETRRVSVKLDILPTPPGGRVEKVTDSIPVPLQFTLPARYVQNPDAAAMNYEVDAFFVHYGRTAGSGHYISYKKSLSPEGQTIWWEINDSNVRALYQREAEAALKQAHTIHFSRI